MLDVTKEITTKYSDCILAQKEGNTTLFIRFPSEGVYWAYKEMGGSEFYLCKLTETDIDNLLFSGNKNLFHFLEVCA